jgi:hypothetical protein
MKQAQAAKKPKGNPRIGQMAKEHGWGFKKGISGNPSGRPSEKPISDRLKAILANPDTLEKFTRSAVKRAIKGHPKLWELVTERVEGKVAQQVDLHASVTHTFTESERKTAASTIESIRAFESEAENAIKGELAEDNE